MPHEDMAICLATYQERIGISIDVLREEVHCAAVAVAHSVVTSARVKDLDTLRKKMLIKRVESIFAIDDVYAFRVIVQSVEDAYHVLGNIMSSFPGHIDHDYIRAPKTNSQGGILQLLQFIAYRNSVPFEIQITTTVFHQINESQHQRYHERKYGTSGL